MRFLHDFRYAVRTLRRSPGLTFVIVASLAIGIGANTAIFSVVHALLLKPLPFPDPERLAVIWIRNPGINIPQDWPSPGQYFDIQAGQRSFENMAISRGRAATLLGKATNPLVGLDDAQRVETLETSSSLFTILGARAQYGRLFGPEHDKPGQPFGVILSHRFWTRAFNADPKIVGQFILLNGIGGGGGNPGGTGPRNQFEVIGVLNPEFELNDEVMFTVAGIKKIDMYIPLPFGADAVTNRRFDENFNVIVRLKPDVTMAQARDDVFRIAGEIRDKDKRDRAFTLEVVSLVESVVGNVRVALLVLLGSVTLVLLIACANVANLLLTRSTGRQKEVAVRTALGASWQRIVAQLLTESMLLALMGGLAGLLVAAGALQIVRSINPGNIPRLNDISLDPTVLAFTFGVSLVTGLLFGAVPAWRAARVDLNSSLKAGGRNAQGEGGFGTSRLRLRSLFVVVEVAISLMLLVGAGLLIRSFARLQNVSPGFEAENVVSLRIGPSGRRFDNPEASFAYYRDFADALRTVPGVTMNGSVSVLPFTASVGWGSVNVEGWTPQPGQELQVDIRNATTDYFRTMTIPTVMGRTFEVADTLANAAPVVIIDETFARRFWPNGDALDKTLWFNPQRKMRIIGVVGVVKQYGLDVEGRIVLYMPSVSSGWHVAKTSMDPEIVGAALVRKVRELDPTMTVVDIQSMETRMSASMARQRFATFLLGAFAMFALLLAVVGVYGVISHLVAQGTHDIGVRMALGAERSTILLMVLRQGMLMTIAGVVIGLAGAYALTRVMATLLFEVSTRDLVTFILVPLVLVVTAMLAAWLPALRATRVNPVVALRDE